MSSINPTKIKHRSPYNYMGLRFYDLKVLMQGEENCRKEIDKQIRRLKRKKHFGNGRDGRIEAVKI